MGKGALFQEQHNGRKKLCQEKIITYLGRKSKLGEKQEKIIMRDEHVLKRKRKRVFLKQIKNPC